MVPLAHIRDAFSAAHVNRNAPTPQASSLDTPVGYIDTLNVMLYRTLYDVADGKFGVHDASFFGMEYHKGFKVRAAPSF
jgi:hypothetical protein